MDDLLLLAPRGRGAFSSAFGSGFAGGVFSTYAQAVQDDEPLAYWHLGEASGTLAEDSQGFLDGTYTNGPTLNQAGLVANNNSDPSPSFDGSNDYVRAAFVAGSKPARFTLEAWVKVNSGDSLMGTVLTDEYDGARVSYILDAFDGTTHSLKPSVGFYNGAWKIAQSASSISTGAIHHLVGTWDGVVLRIYVDGVEAANNTPGANASVDNSHDVFIGSRWDNSGDGQKFHGQIDEVALYDYALSPTQIANHYALGSTTGDATATPSAVAGTGAVPAATVTGTALTPSVVVAGVGAVPAPTAQGAGIAAPSTVAGIGAVPPATAIGLAAGTGAPAVTAGVGAVPAPTVFGAAVALPSATAGTGAVPAPTPTGIAYASPVATNGIGSVPTAVAVGVVNATVTPGVVTGTSRVPHPHALGQGTGGGGGTSNGVTDFWTIKALG